MVAAAAAVALVVVVVVVVVLVVVVVMVCKVALVREMGGDNIHRGGGEKVQSSS